MKVNEEVILAEGKDYDDMQNRFENPELSEYEKQEADRAYQIWANGSMGRNGRLDDDKLSKFMEGRLQNMQEIIKASDKLVSRNGRIVEKKEEPKSEETISKKEYEDLKDEIRDLKKIIMEKFS